MARNAPRRSNRERLPDPEWVDSILADRRYTDAIRLLELPERRQAVLPMVARTRLGRRSEWSMPRYWGTGGLVVASGAKASDVAAVWEMLVRQRAGQVEIRPHWSAAPAFRAVTPPSGVTVTEHTSHVLDLDGGWKRVWADRLANMTRRNIRKAERSALDVEQDSAGQLIDEFYGLYLGWVGRRAQERHLPVPVMRLRAARAEPLAKYRAVVAQLGKACRVFVARSGGEPASGLILLTHGEHGFYWRGYSDKQRAAGSRANDLLQRLAIERAVQEGCRFYDMGESGGVGSLISFKERFGATPRRHPQYKLSRP
jgi:Acetyltransferase (GNAT) domain